MGFAHASQVPKATAYDVNETKWRAHCLIALKKYSSRLLRFNGVAIGIISVASAAGRLEMQRVDIYIQYARC